MRNFYHLVLAFLGSLIYGAPSKKITVVGVTGTKGKSLTLQILDSILESAGRKTALLSSVWMKTGEHLENNPFSNTMPGRGLI
ncbi:MAG: UDP-N-acetylmuramoyl-L-alanyl-D-glutamate-2,6-diaminopimelate ligase, partial [Candidatus Jorgensenbacteria bacterium GW2011_GWC1_48_8]